jgi:GAF domain-containing protein
MSFLQRKAREDQNVMDLLLSVARDMSFRRPPSFLLDQVLGKVAQAMRVEAASLLLLKEDTGRLDFAVVKGLNAQSIRELDVHLEPEEGLAGWVFAHNAAVVVNDPEKDSRFKAGVDWLTGFKTQNLVAVPLRLSGKPFGVLEVVNRKKKEPFTEEDAELLMAIANLLTTTLDNVRTITTLEGVHTHFKALIGNMPGGFAGVDSKGRLTHAGARAAALLDWEEVPLGQPVEVVFKDVKEMGQALRHVLADEKPIIRQTLSVTLRRRGPRVFGYTAFPLVMSGKLLGAGIVFQDIT